MVATRPTNLAEEVVTRIRGWILTAELPPGARLNQSLLASRLGVSRIPVRDAVRQLAAEGLVDLPATGPPTVAALSLDALQELYELREAVEPLACRLAVPNIGRAQLLTMAESLTTMDSRQNTDEWLDAHVRFHAQFYGQSGRPRMIALVENLRHQAERYLRLHLSSPASAHLRPEHEAMMRAAVEGDAALVEKLTLEHLRTSHDLILGHLLDSDTARGTRPRTQRRGGGNRASGNTEGRRDLHSFD